MSESAYTLFDTALGRCAIAWGADGIVAVSFPEESDAQTVARLTRQTARARDAKETDDVPAEIAAAIAGIRALMEGKAERFTDVTLDMDGIGDFDREVYRLTFAIAPGETRTYGDIARAMGDVSESRRVGQALGRNPIPIIVPCHRVVGAGGTMTGFSAPGGTEMKRRLLKIEGAIGPDLLDLMGG